MKKLYLLFSISTALLSAKCGAQVIVGNYGIQYVSTAPSGSCSTVSPIQVVTSSGDIFTCQEGTWGEIGGGGGGGGFPIILGSTSISANSTTTSITGLTVNGVILTTSSPSTQYLDGTGHYTTPAGSGGGLPTATAAGQVPVATGPGTTYTASSDLNNLTSVTVTGPVQASTVTATSDGVHAGYSSLVGNVTPQAIVGNTAGFMGPNLASFSAYACQLPAVGPSSGSGVQTLACGTPVAGVSPGTWVDLFVNPMTASGDLIYGGAGGTPTGLPGNQNTGDGVLVSMGAAAIPAPTTKTCAATASSSNTVTCTFSSAPSAGEFVAVGAFATSGSGPSAFSATDSAGNTYTAAAAIYEGTTNPQTYSQLLYFGPLNAPITTLTLTAVNTGTANVIWVQADTATNVSPFTPVDSTCTADAGGTSSFACSTALTTTSPNDYIFCNSQNTGIAATAGTGFTAGASADTGGLAQYRVFSFIGSLTPTFTTAGSPSWAVMSCAAFQRNIAPSLPSWENAPGISLANASGASITTPVQSTLTAASTISPASPLVGALVPVTGITTVDTITLPTGFASGCFHLLTLSATVFSATGNIATAVTATPNTMYDACYWGSALAKWTIK